MANNELTVVIADGSTKVLRSRDVGGSVQAQVVDVAPAVPTLVAGHQYGLTVGVAAVTLTVPATATHALITVDGAPVRMREDAVSPTATVGAYLPNPFIGELALPNALRFISATGSNATLNVSYRRYV